MAAEDFFVDAPGHITSRATPTAGAWQGDGQLWSQPVLVFKQRAKLVELNNEYAVLDVSGRELGVVHQVGQSGWRKLLRAFSNIDGFLPITVTLYDEAGAPQLSISRGWAFLRSRLRVHDHAGAEVGQIVQENVIGKVRFGLHASGRQVGRILAENWRAWNFRIEDETGREVARITKKWAGLAKELFTTADNYVLEMSAPLSRELRALVMASAVAIDTALNQHER